MWMASQIKEEMSPYLHKLKSDLDVVQSFWVLHLMVLQKFTENIYRGNSSDILEIWLEKAIFLLGF